MTATDVKALSMALAAWERADGDMEKHEAFHSQASYMLDVLNEVGFVIVPMTPTPAMVAITGLRIEDPSPEAWEIAKKACSLLGMPDASENAAGFANIVSDWRRMLATAVTL